MRGNTFGVDMKVSIVIPVYNSEAIIPELCFQICDAMKEYQFEVVLVNDNSQDNSWGEIKKICNKLNAFRGIYLARNFGQDNAIMAGLSFTNGDYVVIMDDDLQHSPYDIPTLLNTIINDWDVCFANFNANKQQSWWKNIGSYINSKHSEYLTNKPKDIYLSPFKIASRFVINAVLEHNGPYPYVDGLICRTTNSITQIPLNHHKRYTGKGNYNLSQSVSVFLKHVTGFSVLPLRLASMVGFITSIIGFFLGIYYIFQYFMSDNVVEGWTSLIVLLLLLGGLILLSLGIIGEYIGRSYLSLNNKPQYVVKKIIND